MSILGNVLEGLQATNGVVRRADATVLELPPVVWQWAECTECKATFQRKASMKAHRERTGHVIAEFWDWTVN